MQWLLGTCARRRGLLAATSTSTPGNFAAMRTHPALFPIPLRLSSAKTIFAMIPVWSCSQYAPASASVLLCAARWRDLLLWLRGVRVYATLRAPRLWWQAHGRPQYVACRLARPHRRRLIDPAPSPPTVGSYGCKQTVPRLRVPARAWQASLVGAQSAPASKAGSNKIRARARDGHSSGKRCTDVANKNVEKSQCLRGAEDIADDPARKVPSCGTLPSAVVL